MISAAGVVLIKISITSPTITAVVAQIGKKETARPAVHEMQRARLSVEINLTSTRYLTDISAEIRRGVGEKHACESNSTRDALAVGEREGRESINTHAVSVSHSASRVVISFIPGVKCLRDKLNCSAQMPLADKKCAPGRNNKIIVI